jgi:hypothetical protein
MHPKFAAARMGLPPTVQIACVTLVVLVSYMWSPYEWCKQPSVTYSVLGLSIFIFAAAILRDYHAPILLWLAQYYPMDAARLWLLLHPHPIKNNDADADVRMALATALSKTPAQLAWAGMALLQFETRIAGQPALFPWNVASVTLVDGHLVRIEFAPQMHPGGFGDAAQLVLNFGLWLSPSAEAALLKRGFLMDVKTTKVKENDVVLIS